MVWPVAPKNNGITNNVMDEFANNVDKAILLP
jgi:hypothetical protein